jgi:hypothetical protein
VLSKWYSVMTVQTAVLSDWPDPRELRQSERLIGQGRRRVSPSQEAAILLVRARRSSQAVEREMCPGAQLCFETPALSMRVSGA